MSDTSAPLLSIVVLTWNNLALTRAFVDSVRQETDVSYELIIVDNGSEPDAAALQGHLGAVDDAPVGEQSRVRGRFCS